MGLQQAVLLLCSLAALTKGGHAAPGAAAYLKAGDATVSRGEWSAAIRHYSAAVEADGGAALAYRKRAKAHSGLGDHRAALRDLGTALDLDPGSVALHLERGRLRRDLCDFAGAEADFRAVLEAKPSHATAQQQLDRASRGLQALEAARMARETGDAAATRAQLATLFGLAAQCTEAKLAEAALQLGEGDYAGVVALTAQVLKAEPSNREALLARAQAYFHLADLDMAKRHVGEALKHDPDDQAAMTQFKTLKKLAKLQQQGREALAKDDWKAAERAFIDALWVDQTVNAVNAVSWIGLCKAQLHLPDNAEALRACTAAVEMNRDMPEPRVLKVRALMKWADWDAAIAEARAARDAHRDNQAVREILHEAEKAKKMVERKDHYAILGVSRDATPRDVKQAYRHAAKRLHPDKSMAEGISKEAAEKAFHDLAEAYEVLSDEEKRRRWDNGEDVQVEHQGHGHPFNQWHMQQGGGMHFQFQWG